MTTTKNTPIWLTVLNFLADSDQRYREAQCLKSMPDERLEDMGLTRTDANRAFLRHKYSRSVDRNAIPITPRA